MIKDMVNINKQKRKNIMYINTIVIGRVTAIYENYILKK